ALARLYRDEWLRRFDEALPRRNFERRPFQKNGRWVPPNPPVGASARAIASHCEQLAALDIPDRPTARMRDELVNAAFSGAALDRDSLATILGGDGATGPKALSAMGFSFTRRDSDPDRARSDLAAAVEIVAA